MIQIGLPPAAIKNFNTAADLEKYLSGNASEQSMAIIFPESPAAKGLRYTLRCPPLKIGGFNYAELAAAFPSQATFLNVAEATRILPVMISIFREHVRFFKVSMSTPHIRKNYMFIGFLIGSELKGTPYAFFCKSQQRKPTTHRSCNHFPSDPLISPLPQRKFKTSFIIPLSCSALWVIWASSSTSARAS